MISTAGGVPKFAEFNQGDETALMRCEDTEKTTAALTKLVEEHKEEGDLTFVLLNEEEEKAKWEAIWTAQSSRSSRGGRRGGRR
jgi:RNA binding motif